MGAEAFEAVVSGFEGVEDAFHDGVGGQGQVELAAEGDEESRQFQGLFGFQEGELDQAALDQVAFGLGLEAQVVQDLFDQAGPALPAVDVGRPRP